MSTSWGTPEHLSEAELADRSGVPLERIRAFADHGFLSGGEAGFRPPDIQRVRLARAMEGVGLSLPQIGMLITRGTYAMTWSDLLFPDPVPTSGRTMEQAATDLGLSLALVGRLYGVWSLPAPEPSDRLRDDDLELLGIIGFVHGALGGDEDQTIAVARTFGENLRRMAESQLKVFRSRMEEPLLASGMDHLEVLNTVSAVGSQLIPAGERILHLLYRRHLEHYLVEDIIENIEIGLDRAGMPAHRTHPDPAIGFLDLSGYTALTEERGDDAATELATKLAELVQRTAQAHGGRAVKLLGDGVMFHFPEVAGGIRCGLDLIGSAEGAGLPAARMGLHLGPVVFRDGDYFGRTVNLAARITDQARPREMLVSAAVVEALAGQTAPPVARFEPVGEAILKGVAAPVSLYRALPAAATPPIER